MQPHSNSSSSSQRIGHSQHISQRALLGQPSFATMAHPISANVSHLARDSTSSIGRASVSSKAMQNEQRARSESQDSRQQQMTCEMDDPLGNDTFETRDDEMMTTSHHGSGQRKRSRLQEEQNLYVKEGLSHKESQAKKTQIDSTIQLLHNQIEQVFAKSERGKTFANKITIQETMRALGLDVFQLLATVINLQEEKAALQYQVIQLQTNGMTQGSSSTGTPAATSYLQAALIKSTATNIMAGKKLPIPEIPQSLKHSPSEKVLIFKAAPSEKGSLLSKEQQENFRKDVHNIIGEELMEGVDVIRPTRNGGHTIIFQTEQARSKALSIFRENERKAQVEEERSCIIAPKKKCAKMVCREPPENMTTDEILHELYGKNNIHLNQIPRIHREARIISTRFGWIFEISSLEAAAIQAQGKRIRYGHARKMKLKEYISLQQCYNCSSFGHNAKNCTSETFLCRLCEKVGHAGWVCPDKDNREKWRCANCKHNNEVKGMNLPTDHAAAQLHKCPCAQNHKELRKIQLSAAGVYTSPILNENIIFQERDGDMNSRRQPRTTGPQQYGKNYNQSVMNMKKHRNRSGKRTQQMFHQERRPAAVTASTFSTTSSSFSQQSGLADDTAPPTQANLETTETQSTKNRMMRVQRPKSYDGWKTAGRQTEREGTMESRGRDSETQQEGTNSTSNLPMVEISDRQKPIRGQLHVHDG